MFTLRTQTSGASSGLGAQLFAKGRLVNPTTGTDETPRALVPGTFELTDVGDTNWASSVAGRSAGGNPKTYAIKSYGNSNLYRGLAWSDLNQLFGDYNVPVIGPMSNGTNKGWFLGRAGIQPMLKPANGRSGAQGAYLMRGGFNLAAPGGFRWISPWIYVVGPGPGRSTAALLASQDAHEADLTQGLIRNCGGEYGYVTTEQARQILTLGVALPASIQTCLAAWSVYKRPVLLGPTGFQADIAAAQAAAQAAANAAAAQAAANAAAAQAAANQKAAADAAAAAAKAAQPSTGATIAVVAAVGIVALLLLRR